MKKTVFNGKSLIVLALFAAFVLFFSLSALWLGDDIIYSYSFKDWTKISSLRDVIDSQIVHYKCVNGRAVAHFLCQLYIPLFGQTAFAISNALVCSGLLLLMASLCHIRIEDWRMMALLSCLILLGFRTKFTPTCQIGFALVTAFLLVLQKYDKERDRSWSNWHLVWSVPLAFFAGWSQEALVIGVAVALGVRVLLNIKKVTWQQWVLLVCFAAGAALLCLSPGAIGRTKEAHSGSLPPVLLSFVKLCFYLRITYLLLAFVLYLRFRRKIKFKELFVGAGFYWIVWATMLLVNLFIGVYYNRQLFGIEVAAIVIIVKYVHRYILPEREKYRRVGTIILSALGMCLIVVAVGNARYLNHQGKVLREIESSYAASADGVVYYNFSAKEAIAVGTRPSDPFNWFVQNTLRMSFGEEKPLRILPDLCADLNGAARENGWENTAPGTIAVIIDKKNPPARVKIQRTLLNRRFSDFEVAINDPFFENDSNKVIMVYETLPFVRFGKVVFE